MVAYNAPATNTVPTPASAPLATHANKTSADALIIQMTQPVELQAPLCNNKLLMVVTKPVVPTLNVLPTCAATKALVA
jgi:hypothetical protein